MKNALILHGRNCTPDMFWYKWLGSELEKAGYEVNIPLLPENTSADRKVWVPFIKQALDFNPESIVVAVSASCAITLEVIENLDTRIFRLALVAGFITPLRGEKTHPAIKEHYNWKKIRKNIQELYIINSDVDPIGATWDKGKEIFDKLGGTQIIMHDQGHFGSIRFNQPYKKFPLLKRLIIDQ